MKYRVFRSSYNIFEDGTIETLGDGKAASTYTHKDGYIYCSLFIGGTPLLKSMHQIVAEVWLPPAPLDGNYEIDHIDDNRANNHKDNLQWLTRSQNVKKSFDTGTSSNTGVENGNCKTDVGVIHEICKILESGATSATLRGMGYDYGLVRRIKCGSAWNSISKDYSW